MKGGKMKKTISLLPIVTLFIVFPIIGNAQDINSTLTGMQGVLDNIYNEMLPLSSRLIDVARGIAGFGALWYIAVRVWRQLASAEPIDFYPLLRPFALGLAIILFPAVLSLLNSVLSPTVSATSAMVDNSNKAIEVLLKQKENAVKKSKQWQIYVGEDGTGNREEWYKYKYPEDNKGSEDRWLKGISNDIQFWMEKQSYNFRNSIKAWLKEVLEVVYLGASLCINTLRTFFLIVLAIVFPLVLGFSVYDGFQDTLTNFIARYVNIYLWLPIANIFGSILGKIQENMIRLDISQIESGGDTFFSSTDTAYLVFLLIGIVGFFSVPNVAGYIIQAGGHNTLLQRVNTTVITGGQAIMGQAQQGSATGTESVRAVGGNYSELGKQLYSSLKGNSNDKSKADTNKKE
ncbi:Bacteroides conjugative transposon TraJ protein [Sphingobacterium thalpophilum]|uniref:Bacteroides conjugative transposon TraJ protein n=2 Tax=Sphingobacterium thalpophilum TaxID=259 RepID=A0A4U9V8F2_9SPHI|nr:Bacteroides conjugative transposon TraJ protein [Sphingobacterium thalpophilum]